MNSLERFLVQSSIILIAACSFDSSPAVPADYSIYPHLSSTVPLAGENRGVEGFHLWGEDYFAVCNEASGLFIYQVSGESLVQVGALSTIGQELDIAIVDWFGYVVTSGGLTALSLAVPNAPLSLGFLSLSGGGDRQVTASANHAFVACGAKGLAIVDITNAGFMFVVAWYGEDVDSVTLDGDRLGVTNNGRFELLDVSDPSYPTLLGYCETISMFDYFSAAMEGTTVYTSTGGQVDRWDFSDPSNPILDSGIPFVDLPITNGGNLRIQDNELQVTGANYLGFFDFSTGALLREASQIWLTRDVDTQAGIIVTSVRDALHVYSGGLHAHPEPAGSFDPTGHMNPRGVMLGDILYGPSLTQSLTITAVDLNDEAAHLWDLDMGFQTGIREYDHRGSLLSTLSWAPYHLKLITVSRYGTVERGTIALTIMDPGQDAVAFLGDEHMVVFDTQYGDDFGRFQVLDVSNPDIPTLVHSYPLELSTTDPGFWVAGPVILVGDKFNLDLIDARDPLALAPGATLSLGAQFFFTSGDWLYSVHSAYYGAALRSWDLSDPAHPFLVGELPITRLEGFVSSGNYAYQEETGLILDLSDPAHPVPAGNLSLANPSLNPMSGILPGGQYILTGNFQNSAPYYPLHYLDTQGGTGEASPVPDDLPEAPGNLNLQATPNPFNPRVTIQFELHGPAATRIEVFDVRGRLMASLGVKHREAGVQSVAWDGTDRDGRNLPSGVYLARVRAGKISESLKIVLAR